MSIDTNVIIYKELNIFIKNIQDYKNKVLMNGLKAKFKNSTAIYVLEKLSELESNFFKKFALYYSADKEINEEMIINTISSIEFQYQNLLSKYFFKI